MGKVIDVEFRATDRGRWCVRCDEPFPEGTAMCPRCGGDLSSASRHRAETADRARKRARRVVATGAGLALLIAAALAWLLVGGGVAHGDEKVPPSPPPSEPLGPPSGTTVTPPPAPKRGKKEKVAAVVPKPPPDSSIPLDGEGAPRAVRVRLLDGSSVVGTVHAEEATQLVIDCSLGMLSIPRARISTIAYDAAAGAGSKRAPVQQLDDEDKPTKKRSSAQ